MTRSRLLILSTALAVLGVVLVGCGPTAEEQAGADRMQKGIEASRNATAPGGAATGGAAPAAANTSR